MTKTPPSQRKVSWHISGFEFDSMSWLNARTLFTQQRMMGRKCRFVRGVCVHGTSFYHDGSIQGWRQEFSNGGLTLPMRGLKILFLGYFHCQKYPKNSFSPSDRGLTCSDGGAIATSSPPLAPPLDRLCETVARAAHAPPLHFAQKLLFS